MKKIIIEVVRMNGSASGQKALKVTHVTDKPKTIGFIIPINYWFEGYWGGINYMTTSFITNQSKLCKCIDEMLKEFDMELHEFNPPKNWDKLNTMFE